jgi:hypothetical protein
MGTDLTAGPKPVLIILFSEQSSPR